jgi:PAS domain S-box-containing protein
MAGQEPKSLLRILLALLLPFVTCGVQWLFCSTIKPFVWFLFFPTAFFSSRIGGKSAGLVSTAISALLVVYFFIPPQLSFLDKNPSHLNSVLVFLFMGILFSFTHERLERANCRAVEALEESRIANEQLQEARIGRLQAEQKLMEDHLRMSEERFRSIFNHSPIAIGIGRRDDGRLVEVNGAWLRLYGFERDEVLGKTTAELGLYVSVAERDKIVEDIEKLGQIVNREVRLRRKSGDAIDVQYSAKIIEQGGESFLLVMITDITAQKRSEASREATVELLRICNRADNLSMLMQDLMHYFQKVTGCEAIGVRLADGDDFPYYETRGFSEEFVLAEKCLCAYDQKGELIRDCAGHPALDCMCGNILRGRSDPSKPFFTPRGSFWSSCTSELLASTSDADRQAKTRNRCNGEGYESVALIPLRYRDETYGLFQFNDREKGYLSTPLTAGEGGRRPGG